MGNHISISTVYPFVQLRTGLRVTDYQDLIPEWLAEAERKIGTNAWLIDQTPSQCNPLILAVNNYRALLPKDFYEVSDIQYCAWNNVTGCNCGQQPCACGGSAANANGNGALAATGSIYTYDSPYLYSYLKLEIKDWRIEGCYIKVPFQSGNLRLMYYAMPLDVDGLPLILESHRDAIAQYITYQLLEGQYAQKKIDVNMLVKAEMRWLDLCVQARSKDNMPSRRRLGIAANINNDPNKIAGIQGGYGYGGSYGNGYDGGI